MDANSRPVPTSCFDWRIASMIFRVQQYRHRKSGVQGYCERGSQLREIHKHIHISSLPSTGMQLVQMAAETIHPSEELRGPSDQNPKRTLLYVAEVLSIERGGNSAMHSRKAKPVPSAERNTMWSRDADVTQTRRPRRQEPLPRSLRNLPQVTRTMLLEQSSCDTAELMGLVV